MTGPLPHCPKNNLNHPVKTEPVTVGADTLFLFFLTYIAAGPSVFIHLFVQYSLFTAQSADPGSEMRRHREEIQNGDTDYWTTTPPM